MTQPRGWKDMLAQGQALDKMHAFRADGSRPPLPTETGVLFVRGALA